MQRILFLIVVSLVVFGGNAALAEEGKGKKDGHAAAAGAKVNGEIVSVDVVGNKVVVKVGGGDSAKEQTIATNASTVVTIDGASKTLGDLTAGQKAKIAIKDDVATSIAVGGAAHGGEGKKKK